MQQHQPYNMKLHAVSNALVHSFCCSQQATRPVITVSHILLTRGSCLHHPGNIAHLSFITELFLNHQTQTSSPHFSKGDNHWNSSSELSRVVFSLNRRCGVTPGPVPCCRGNGALWCWPPAGWAAPLAWLWVDDPRLRSDLCEESETGVVPFCLLPRFWYWSYDQPVSDWSSSCGIFIPCWVYCWYCGWKLWIASCIMSRGFIVSFRLLEMLWSDTVRPVVLVGLEL